MGEDIIGKTYCDVYNINLGGGKTITDISTENMFTPNMYYLPHFFRTNISQTRGYKRIGRLIIKTLK